MLSSTKLEAAAENEKHKLQKEKRRAESRAPTLFLPQGPFSLARVEAKDWYVAVQYLKFTQHAAQTEA